MVDAVATSAAHVRLARQIGGASAVLLKNDELPPSPSWDASRKRLLPLRRTDRVALIGSVCDAPHTIDVERDDWTVAARRAAFKPASPTISAYPAFKPAARERSAYPVVKPAAPTTSSAYPAFNVNSIAYVPR